MKFDNIRNAVTSKVGRQVLVVQKNSPTILFVGGIAGVVATTVLASRATLRLDEVLMENQAKKAQAHEVRRLHPEQYSETDLKKDMTVLYIQSALQVTKLYGPSIVVGIASIAALTGSHRILNNRLAGVTAAYQALDRGFREYRERVANEIGPEKEAQLRYAAEQHTFVEDTEKGPKKINGSRPGPNGASIYAVWFDEYSPSWQANPEYNRYFLECQQNYANDLLKSRGHIFLNEVYDMLGIPRSKAGQVVGWVLGNGDSFVDFGLYNPNDSDARTFINRYENSILLDFNVDGIVYNLIGGDRG